MTEEENEFLGKGEEVISSLQCDTRGLFVTNWRLIELYKTEDDKKRTLQDFNYKYISHIHCESTEGATYRSLGIISIIVGLSFIWAGYSDYYKTLSMSLGIIFIIVGSIGILSKPEMQSIFKIDVIGIPNPITITLPVSASDMDLILKPLANMRRRAGD